MTRDGITVLYVDREEGFKDVVRSFLQRWYDDITVITARTEADAVDRLESDGVDFVISDHGPPELDGLALLEAVRERDPDLPFVLYTRRDVDDFAARAINAGTTDYVPKRPEKEQYAALADRIRSVTDGLDSEVELNRAVLQTEAQFELLVESVEDYAIFVLDTDGHVRTWNRGAEAIKGYTRDEILGEHFSVFYRDEDREAGVPDRNLRDAAEEGRVRDEGWRVRKDGSEFWADVTITALDADGEVIGYVKITLDMTQRHRERQLLEQNERLQEFLAAIAHDLRSPLNVAQGNVELASETGDLSRLDAAERALDRVAELLDHLTTLAKEGRRILDPEPVALRAIAEAAWATVEIDGAELRVVESTTVTADRSRLQQLLENLFRNSVEHGGPEVTVRVGLLDDADGFYVADDGPGIPEDERQRVFQIGYSTDDEGGGFGLAMAMQIADAHGWFIRVTDAEDGGTRFEITGVTTDEHDDTE